MKSKIKDRAAFQFNTSKAIDEMKVSTSVDSLYLNLKEIWSVIREHQSLNLGIDRQGLSPLDMFMYFARKGEYPPPEVILLINECFELYFDSKGGVSLDEAFFGESNTKKGVGNFAAQRAKVEFYYEFELFILAEREKHPPSEDKHKSAKRRNEVRELQLEDFAEKFIEVSGLKTDYESFLRNYRRWKLQYKNREKIKDK